jgi:hypothetical protein
MTEEELEYWLNFVIANQDDGNINKDDGQGTQHI